MILETLSAREQDDEYLLIDGTAMRVHAKAGQADGVWTLHVDFDSLIATSEFISITQN